MSAIKSTQTVKQLPFWKGHLAVSEAIKAASQFPNIDFSFQEVQKIIQARKILERHDGVSIKLRCEIADVVYGCVQESQVVSTALQALQFEYSGKAAELIYLMSQICEPVQNNTTDGLRALAICGFVCFFEFCFTHDDILHTPNPEADAGAKSSDCDDADGIEICLSDDDVPDTSPGTRSPPVTKAQSAFGGRGGRGGRGRGRAPACKAYVGGGRGGRGGGRPPSTQSKRVRSTLPKK